MASACVAPTPQRYRRLRFVTDVDVRADLMEERARSHDLSGGGMFVDAAQDYAIGMTIKLRFRLHRRWFEPAARIVHVKPQIGFGAEFVGLSPGDRQDLLRFIHRLRATREAELLLKASAR